MYGSKLYKYISTWRQCCANEIKAFVVSGQRDRTFPSNPKTVMRWNMEFRLDEILSRHGHQLN